jgi:hypothetical protein
MKTAVAAKPNARAGARRRAGRLQREYAVGFLFRSGAAGIGGARSRRAAVYIRQRFTNDCHHILITSV